jgi:hypothetical protein
MSAKIKLTTLAALLIVLSVHGAASAQSNGEHYVSGYRASRAATAQIPSNAFGSIDDRTAASFGQSPYDIVYSGKVVGRDPDPKVRSEFLRDGVYSGRY